MQRTIESVKGLHYLNGIRAFKKNPLIAMDAFQKKYGDLPFFGGPLNTLFLFSPEDIKQVLIEEKHNNEKGDQAKLMRVALGDGLLTTEGEEWRKKKAIIQKVFHHQSIANYSPLIESVTFNHIKNWKNQSVLDISEEIMALSFKVSSEIFFGGISDDAGKKIRNAFYLIGKILAKKFSSPIKLPFSFPSSDHLILKEQVAILDEFIFKLIKSERKKANSKNESFLGRLISSSENLSDRQIRDEVVTFMGAGYETTATFITWAIYSLLKHPEQLDIFKNSPMHSIERKNILQETLRLYPSFPINVRQNITPIQLAGSTLKAKTNLLISPYITHRDQKLWERPEEFYPERFNSLSSDVVRSQFIPFLIGPKKCIGEQLAYEEAEIILDVLFKNVHLELLTKELTPVCDILLYSHTPLLCKTSLLGL